MEICHDREKYQVSGTRTYFHIYSLLKANFYGQIFELISAANGAKDGYALLIGFRGKNI